MSKVLVVEDELLVRLVLAQDLIDLGYEVVEAGDGHEAVLALEQERADILLTDIRLPGGMDGWAIAERARQIDPNMCVVYVTGYAPDHPVQVEGSVLMTKPYRIDAVVRLFEDWGHPPHAHAA